MLKDLVLYFLKLGATGFGGPIALAGYMHRDLVETKKWFTQQEYNHGLALAQIVPGPLAAQLAIYFGYLKGKIIGATLVAIVFLLPSFCMVLALAAFYSKAQSLPWLKSFSWGMNAAVVAVIIQATLKLVPATVGRRKGLWLLFLFAAIFTVYREKPPLLLFLGGGLAAMLCYAFPKTKGRFFAVEPITLFFFFAKAAMVIYGGGMAIIPFIYHDVVITYQWLTDKQFLDAVTVGMITPGPLMITAGFIGYLTAKLPGAIASVIGVFIPVYLFVIFCASWFHKILRNPQIHAFVEGITVTAIGTIAAAALLLARQAITDWQAALITLGALGLILKTKIPVPLTLLGFGLAGILLQNLAN